MKVIATIKLKHNKDTKGTYVYTMIAPNDVEIGNVYLPKLLLEKKPAAELKMQVIEEGE